VIAADGIQSQGLACRFVGAELSSVESPGRDIWLWVAIDADTKIVPSVMLSSFSRKIENHMAAVAINYFAYNFIKIHRTLRVTPAMAAGVTTACSTCRIWWPS